MESLQPQNDQMRAYEQDEDSQIKDFTPKQLKAYHELKELSRVYTEEKVENRVSHPMFLAIDQQIRFLRARDFDSKKALEMFKKWVDWRLEFKADQIDPESIRSLLLKETIILHKNDLQNRYCIIIRARFHTPKAQTIEDLIRYGIYLIEQATFRTEQMGSKQLAVIYDRNGMTSDNRDTQLMSFTTKFISLLQDFYAERLAMVYVLHANWLYKLAFGIVKPFLAQKTKEKIKIIGDIKELVQFFDADCLLPEHGGTSNYAYDPFSEFGLNRE